MAKLIPLSKGYSAVVDDEDFEWLNAFKWSVWTSRKQTTQYARRSVYPSGRRAGHRPQLTVRMHRLILPGAALVDHRDGDGLNNQRANLRAATPSGNAQNIRMRRNNTSGLIGVAWHRHSGLWQARISVNGRSKYLGLFADPAEAARVRDAAAVELHGEFASLNFPAVTDRECVLS